MVLDPIAGIDGNAEAEMIRRSRFLIVAIAAVAAASCAQRVSQTDTGEIATARWSATLARPAAADSTAAPGNIIGSVAVSPGNTISETRVTVMLANATPGAVYPWHIHAGSCGNDNGIVGPTPSYEPITIGSDGKGEVTTTLPFSTPTTGEYFVNIHKSSTEMGTIVACGDLALGSLR
jgi:hypothetical protein